MKRWMLAAALVAALANAGMMPAATAEPTGKPLFSDMKNENDLAVQQVRDALMAFNGMKKRWPADIAALAAFARENNLPLDLAAFTKAVLTVQTEGTASVAVFEFVTKGSPTKGAFAMVNYIVK